jgi:hypothetical protein
MRIVIDKGEEIRSVNIKTLKHLMDRRFEEVVRGLNVAPELVDSEATSLAVKEYTQLQEILNRVGQYRQRLWLTTGYVLLWKNLTVHTPVNILYWCHVFGASSYYIIPYALNDKVAGKRLPRHYVKLFEFRSEFSPVRNRACRLFFAIPRETPPIAINYLPVFRDGKVVFVRKDKISQLQLQA